MKNYLNTFNTEPHCVHFFILILSILFKIKTTNLNKSYSQFSKKHDQPSINLTNVFDFKG